MKRKSKGKAKQAPAPVLVSSAQCARILKVERAALVALMDAGKVPVTQQGTRRLVNVEECRAIPAVRDLMKGRGAAPPAGALPPMPAQRAQQGDPPAEAPRKSLHVARAEKAEHDADLARIKREQEGIKLEREKRREARRQQEEAEKANPPAPEPRPGPGRPTDYKPEYCEMLIRHMENGYSFESFAGIVRQGRSTIYQWIDANPDFADAKTRGNDLCRLWWEEQAVEGIFDRTDTEQDGDIRRTTTKRLNGAVWRLNMLNRFGPGAEAGKGVWTDRQQLEHSGRDGRPIQTESTDGTSLQAILKVCTDDELRTLQGIAARAAAASADPSGSA